MPDATPARYEVFAIRYATRMAPAHDWFIGAGSDEPARRMDYFVWVVRNAERTVVLDTGHSAPVAAKRGRDYLRTPADSLRALGIEPAQVQQVVLSHMHWDHVGNTTDFPNATFSIQAREMAFYTGGAVRHARFRRSIETEDILNLVRANYDGRLHFNEGDEPVAPGISLHLVGGHTIGSQVMRVWTARGWVVLAADATHSYDEIEQQRPFPTLHNLEDMCTGWETINRLADSPAHVIPGHDALVMERYPAISPSEPLIVRLA